MIKKKRPIGRWLIEVRRMSRRELVVKRRTEKVGFAEILRSWIGAGAVLMSREVRRTIGERDISSPGPCLSPDTSFYSLPTQSKTPTTSPLSRPGIGRSTDRPSSTPDYLRFIPTLTTPYLKRPPPVKTCVSSSLNHFKHQEQYHDENPMVLHQ
jgi:hypothetical protein